MSKKNTIKEEQENAIEATDTDSGVNSDNPDATSEPKNKKELEEQPEVEVVDPLLELQKQIDETKDKYIRLSAEFDNFRKRTQREKMDLIRYGAEDALKGVLPLVDDFERAIKHSETATDVEAMKQGLILIHGKFKEFLKTNGVNEIDAFGQELNTDMHEAITKFPTNDKKLKGKIVDVVEKGYKLNDKVIRFSKVVIGE